MWSPSYERGGSGSHPCSHLTSRLSAESQHLDRGKWAGGPGLAVFETWGVVLFGRAVEQNRSGRTRRIVYGPSGAKFAFMNGSTLIEYIDPMVAGMAAIHNGNGTGYFQHADWLGSSRFAQDGGGNVIYDRAYAPFGEPYDEYNNVTTNRNFTGQTRTPRPDCMISCSARRARHKAAGWCPIRLAWRRWTLPTHRPGTDMPMWPIIL